MLASMAKKKPTTGGPRSNRKGVQVNGYIPEQVKRLMEQLAEKNHRTFTGEMIVAFEKHLEANGLWPPTEDDQED